ncbi:unnamed protein product [Closterium sp. Naga37s-1]|nr:unnamed protein product [Closterium sp. Naga37s-1]
MYSASTRSTRSARRLSATLLRASTRATRATPPAVPPRCALGPGRRLLSTSPSHASRLPPLIHLLLLSNASTPISSPSPLAPPPTRPPPPFTPPLLPAARAGASGGVDGVGAGGLCGDASAAAASDDLGRARVGQGHAYGLTHISAGDLLRAEVAAGTEGGRQAKAHMDAGRLVPDDVVVTIVKNRLAQEDAQSRGWLLDGYPRSLSQAHALLALDISPDPNWALERLPPAPTVTAPARPPISLARFPPTCARWCPMTPRWPRWRGVTCIHTLTFFALSSSLSTPSSALFPTCMCLCVPVCVHARHVQVPHEILVERVVGRRLDPATNRIYHLSFSPPESEEIAARLTQRSDDTEEKVKARLETHNANVASVLDMYAGKLVQVNGHRGKEEVFGDIDSILTRLQQGQLSFD